MLLVIQILLILVVLMIWNPTLGYTFTLACSATTWISVKHTIVSSEIECAACYEVTIQVVWLNSFISGLQVVKSIFGPIKMYAIF